MCEEFLRAAPGGLVTGLYLRGGIGFGEWVEGQSDIDFVATLARRPTQQDVDGLRAAHEQVWATYPRPSFDGLHVTADDLRSDPRDCPDVPITLGGQFSEEHPGDAMVTWHELALNGLTVHGPDIGTLDVWTDAEALRDFTRHNLDTYWRANAEALTKMPSEGAREDACCWCVLGVARVHHLLVTGEMTTKSGAGRWGLTYYPERFHRVLREALRIREGGLDRYAGDPAQRGHDTAAFTAYVVDAATALDRTSADELPGRLRSQEQP